MAKDEMIVTQEGYDKLVAEHEELTAVRRLEVAERLKEAISYGDLSAVSYTHLDVYKRQILHDAALGGILRHIARE